MKIALTVRWNILIISKGILLLIFLSISFYSSFAQTEKGTIAVGNSFFFAANDKDKAANLYLQLNTGVSYFIAKNLETGLSYNWTRVKTREYADEHHDIEGKGGGLYARYYVFLKRPFKNEQIKVAVFFQAGANISFSDHDYKRDADDPGGFKQTFKQFNVHPGLALMIGKNWSFECSFRGLTYERYKNNDPNYNDDRNSWDFFGLGMSSLQNNPHYYMDIKKPGLLFMGGIRYHF